MRYTRMYALPQAIFFPNAPISVEAGALLWDSEENRALAQLKLKNLSSKTVAAVTLAVVTLDASGASVETQVHTYSGLAAGSGAEFGQNEGIALSGTAAAFTVNLLRVDFSTGERWQPYAAAPQASAQASAPAAACKPVTGIRRWLPLLITAAGVLLWIISQCVIRKYELKEYLYIFLSALDLSSLAGCFALPLIYWLLAGTRDYARLRKPSGIVLLAFSGVQVLAAMLVAFATPRGSLFEILNEIPGRAFLSYFIGWLRRPSFINLLAAVAQGAFIAKNLLAGIFLLKAKK